MSAKKLAEHLSELEDPRCRGKVEHLLIDILVIAVCAVIAGGRELGRHGALWSEQGGLAVDFPEGYRTAFRPMTPSAVSSC